MKKYIIILFTFIGSFVNAQGYDFQALCIACAAQNGFYCGDDPANWTQYSPNGCVPNGFQDLFYLNDGWEDCVDGSDEADAEPTSLDDCAPTPPPPGCDTVYIEVPVIEYEYIYETDTIIEYETVVETEYIYQTDTITIYDNISDTLFVDVIEYVDVIVYDTVVETEYIELVEYVTEYIDCDTGLPCESSIGELLDKSTTNNIIYNIKGQAVLTREGLYIEDGKIYYKTK